MIRGYLRHLVLAALKDDSLSGYDLMNQLGSMLGSKPSPGSIYPLLSELEKEGVIAVKEDGKSKRYHLTVKGEQERDRLSAVRSRLHEQMREHMRMYSLLSGDDNGFFEHIMDSLKKGERPFKELAWEMNEFKRVMGAIAVNGLTASKRAEIRKIMMDANRKLEVVLRNHDERSSGSAEGGGRRSGRGKR